MSDPREPDTPETSPGATAPVDELPEEPVAFTDAGGPVIPPGTSDGEATDGGGTA